MMSDEEILARGLEVESFFCENNFIHLRRAFNWIQCGKWVSKTKKYSPFDGVVAYHRIDQDTIDETANLQVGRFDFKTSQRDFESTMNTFSISKACHEALMLSPDPLLIIYIDSEEELHVFNYRNARIGPSPFEKSVGIMNLREILIDTTHYPMS